VVVLVSAVSAAVTVAVALLPQLDFAYRMPALYVAFETAAPLVALLAGLVVFGRFLRRAQLIDLALACSLGALALSELAFVTLPVLVGHVSQDLSVWAALGGRGVGAVLFALAAFLSRPRLRRPVKAAAASGTTVATTVLLIGVLAAVFAARWPTVPVVGTEPAAGHLPAVVPGLSGRPDLHVAPGLLAAEIAVVVIYGLAAAGFLRRAQRSRDRFWGWLAVAAVLAAASHVNYVLYPGQYSPFVSLGDLFRLSFYAVVLAGSAREIWSYWRALSEVAVLEERRRIARDLHDGLAQELAYLVRNLESVDGPADRDMTARLHRTAERAQLEARLAISTLAAPRRQPVTTAIAQAVSEVAARGHVKLELDVVPGIRLPAPRAEAVVRIACEAVGNAARHSGAERVCLSLHRNGTRVRLCVSDTGSGFDPAVPPDGFGLTSMRERASSVGGDLRISSVPGHGTEVEVML
jgi:signal transduction histidine kinase